MTVKIVPNPDGSVDILNGNMEALLSFDVDGNASFPKAANIYTKENASVLASLTLASGGIIESDSNPDGKYTKFADGTLINSKRLAGSGSGFSVIEWPIPFIDTDYEVSGISSSSNSSLVIVPKVKSFTTTGCEFTVVAEGLGHTNATADLIAKGRWKA